MKTKIICLGNEFINEDSLAKKVGDLLKDDFEVVNIKSSFELISILNSNKDIVILDVVLGLSNVKEISINELRTDSIVSAHDFDASFVLKLIGENKKIKIIGIPMNGDVEKIKDDFLELIGDYGFHSEGSHSEPAMCL